MSFSIDFDLIEEGAGLTSSLADFLFVEMLLLFVALVSIGSGAEGTFDGIVKLGALWTTLYLGTSSS